MHSQHRAVILKRISLLKRVILMERSVSHSPNRLFTYKSRVPADKSVESISKDTLHSSVKNQRISTGDSLKRCLTCRMTLEVEHSPILILPPFIYVYKDHLICFYLICDTSLNTKYLGKDSPCVVALKAPMLARRDLAWDSQWQRVSHTEAATMGSSR